MALMIKVVGYKGSPPIREISAQFDEQGGSIGRSPDNHLVLPDPEKFISRLHARILFQDGRYFIQDSSTAGSYLGPKQQFLHQSQAALVNGERLRIGDYELSVSIDATAQAGPAPDAEPVRQLELAEGGLLEHPFTEPSKPAPSDFFDSFIEQAESSVFHDSFTPPLVADTVPPTAGDELDFSDLLSSLDALPSAGEARQAELPPLPDDFFAEEQGAPESPVMPEIRTDAASPFSDVTLEPLPAGEGFPQAEADALAAQSLSSDPFALAEKPLSADELQESSVFQIPRPTAISAKTAGVETMTPAPVPAVVSEPVTVSDSELISQFLAGAGITDSGLLPAEQWPALMKTSGELLRSMVEGLMLVLRARAELKSQFRVSVTTMRPVNNNPLKFTPNADDALKLILAPTHPGFLGPKEAVSEGFADLMHHQLAMTAGIQAALAEILRSFDPALIEKSQTEGVLFQKKAKCWEHYAEIYPQLKTAAQEDFFGEAFADAYEKQMRLLSSAAKPQ